MTAANGTRNRAVAPAYRCNLKCLTCDLAEKVGAENVTPVVLGRLPTSLR